MTSKTLSTSTLSLKFMQNAHRAQQLKEVELDRAEVVDDGKWEISQAVRESWGIPSGNQTNFQDIHEASYLPFLFSDARIGTSVSKDDDAAIVKKASGRRIFDKRGEEVSLLAASQPPPVTESPTNPKIHNRPTSITSSRKSGHLQGFDELDRARTANTAKASRVQKNSKSAREAIFENDGVGADIRASRSDNANAIHTPPSTSMFIKPAGIDEPSHVQSIPSSRTLGPEQFLDGARQKKTKRPREQVVGEGVEVSKKEKKKKKTSVV